MGAAHAACNLAAALALFGRRKPKEQVVVVSPSCVFCGSNGRREGEPKEQARAGAGGSFHLLFVFYVKGLGGRFTSFYLLCER